MTPLSINSHRNSSSKLALKKQDFLADILLDEMLDLTSEDCQLSLDEMELELKKIKGKLAKLCPNKYG